MIIRLVLFLFLLLISGSSYAQMTPEEQMLSVALQGEEASLAAASSGTTAVRSAIEIMNHKKDDQIKDLQTQISKLNEQIAGLKDQLSKVSPNVEVQGK